MMSFFFKYIYVDFLFYTGFYSFPLHPVYIIICMLIYIYVSKGCKGTYTYMYKYRLYFLCGAGMCVPILLLKRAVKLYTSPLGLNTSRLHNKYYIITTVKPLYSGHHRELKNVHYKAVCP